MIRFTDQSMPEVVLQLQEAIAQLSEAQSRISFEALDPDVSSLHFPGEWIEVEGRRFAYRSHQTWMELAEQLGCRYLTPRLSDGPFLQFGFALLDGGRSWHEQSLPSGDAEKYGATSGFFRIHKLEEPSFFVHYLEVLKHLPLPPGARLLNLGINRGDEWLPFASLYSPEQLTAMRFVGVDHAASALAVGAELFQSIPGEYQWIEADLNALETLELGLFDLIISVGTLHSPKLRSREIFSDLVRKHLTPGGHIVIGFPNCRFIDHLVRYGAKVKNYSRPELSLLWKEVSFHKRYLQQHKFRVTITGKHTIFVTGHRLP